MTGGGVFLETMTTRFERRPSFKKEKGTAGQERRGKNKFDGSRPAQEVIRLQKRGE